ncbi:MAG: hypothetical protein KGH63_02115 [Candidatus Micrarchaeota archaeon]|nr:hypothetical protein [Candidatus Micrarchaeota archaeon]
MTFALCPACYQRHKKHPGIAKAAAPAGCYICQGMLEHLQPLADQALEKAASAQWASFLVQTTFPRQVMVREENLWDDEAPGETMALKNHLNRLAIDYLEKKSGKPYQPDGEMALKLDFRNMKGEALPANLFVFGHYNKKSRLYCQHDWACSACRGRGCKVCNFHKQNYPSIEGALRSVFAPAFGAAGGRLHASGREDVDVRALGGGRPFVLELLAPQKREANLEALAGQVAAIRVTDSDGGVSHPLEVKGLEYVSSFWVEAVCNSHFDKHYRATVQAQRPLTREDWQKLKAAGILRLEKMAGTRRRAAQNDPLMAGPLVLEQRTPTRVAGRRTDMVRKRRVYEIRPVSMENGQWVLDIYAEAGTYIKELVHGDNGRTVPSISSILGTPCQCAQLDVTGIEDAFLLSIKKS